MLSQPIKIGIAGIGRAGWRMHCEELKGREDKFKIVAACDLIQVRREKMAERYGCRTYEHIEDLIADPEVELVDIATRSCDHYAHAMMALEAGKFVFLEKPICTTYKEAVGLKAAADKRPGKLFIRHNRRFDPDFLHVKDIIASGILGETYEIKLARHGYGRRDDWQTIKAFGGGQLLNWGPHIIDHALIFLGSPVKEIYSNLKRIAAVGDAEDHIKIVLTGENHRVVDLEISGGVAIPYPLYTVYGTKGSMVVSDNNITLKYLNPDNILSDKHANPGTPGETFGTPEILQWIEETIPLRQGDNYVIWDELFKAVRFGTQFPIKLEEAVRVMEVISKAKGNTEFEL